MKKLWSLFVFAALSVVAFTSCETGTDEQNLLVGQWKITNTQGYVKVGSEVIEEWNEPYEDDELIMFTSNGVMLSYLYDDGLWELDERGRYNQVDDKLVYTLDGEDEVYIINVKQLTKDKLILELNETTEEEGTINFTTIASDNGTSFSTNGRKINLSVIITSQTPVKFLFN